MADVKPVSALARASEVARHEVPAWARHAKDGVQAWSPSSGGGGGQRPAQEDSKGAAAKPQGTPRSRAEKRPRVQIGTKPPAPLPPVGAVPLQMPAAEEPLHDSGPGGTGARDIPDGALVLTPEQLEAHEQALVEALREPYLDAARRFDEAIEELGSRLEEDIVTLAARLASALVQRAVKEDRNITLDILQRALRLAGPLEHVTIRCSAEDAELLRERAPGLARAEAGRAVDVAVRPSDDIASGGCVLTWEGGVVDARNERRLERIVEAVKNALAEEKSK